MDHRGAKRAVDVLQQSPSLIDALAMSADPRDASLELGEAVGEIPVVSPQLPDSGLLHTHFEALALMAQYPDRPAE